MKIISPALSVVVLLASFVPAFAQSAREQCTSALILPESSTTGGPILWKNRDTEFLSNKVVFVDEKPHSYLCLANAGSDSGRSCWAGLNSTGFGIINTVAYNLPNEPNESKDLEGIIMADALRTCASVDEFEAYVKKNLGAEFGSLANFGVIDGSGHAMLFEIHNHGYEKQDPAAAPGSCLINTNYARSGDQGKGAGYLRFERARELFAELPEGPIDFRTILGRFSRDTGHVLLDQPTVFELTEIPDDRDFWISTRDTINKAYTSATVVLVGRNPLEPGSIATMWVIPGEPVTAVAIPLWVEAGASPSQLWEGEEAPFWVESARLKNLIRPFEEGNKKNYLNLTVLDNREGTGYLPAMLAVEKEIMDHTSAFLDNSHTAEEYQSFQNLMAQKAYDALKTAASQ